MKDLLVGMLSAGADEIYVFGGMAAATRYPKPREDYDQGWRDLAIVLEKFTNKFPERILKLKRVNGEEYVIDDTEDRVTYNSFFESKSGEYLFNFDNHDASFLNTFGNMDLDECPLVREFMTAVQYVAWRMDAGNPLMLEVVDGRYTVTAKELDLNAPYHARAVQLVTQLMIHSEDRGKNLVYTYDQGKEGLTYHLGGGNTFSYPEEYPFPILPLD